MTRATFKIVETVYLCEKSEEYHRANVFCAFDIETEDGFAIVLVSSSMIEVGLGFRALSMPWVISERRDNGFIATCILM